ncbi:MAG TPA: SurA N-terminal domain-containing protein, partial [Caldilineaceae bacterium]|nr:SurA N-terminal domain-containing protein [Caldilineaceae bacterium]
MARRKPRAEEQQRELTRKEHRIRARDRERNRRLMIGTAIALGLAAVVIVFGLVNEFFLRPRSSVATVGGTEIVTRDYWKRVFLEQNQLQNQLVRLDQLERQFGGQGFFASQISQIQATLGSPFSLGVEVLDRMIREEVIRQQAAARGITVTEEEIDEALREEVASSLGVITIPQATATAEAAAAATATA